MIRRKKNDTDIDMNPLSEEDTNIDISEDISEEDMLEENADKPKKKRGSFQLPWKKKAKADGMDVDADAKADDGADSEDKYDPLNLSEDGVEYMSEDDEKKKPKKKIIIIAAVIVLAIALVISLIVRNIDTGSDSKVYVESVGVITGLTSSTGVTNRYTGVVEAQESWKITLDADMSVSKCYVQVGDEVKKGDKLFAYNTDELKLNQEKKELEVETLQNEITQLTKDISSYQSDLKSASASEKIELQTQILTSQTTIKKDEYSIKSDKEEITKIKKNIKDATVTSKMDGVIKSINASLGEGSSDDDSGTDTSATDGTDNSVYMTVLSVGDYRVKGKITETNVSSIAEGDRVIVNSRTDDSTWTGLISTVKTDATTSDDSSSSSTNDYSMDDGSSSAEGASSYYFYIELDNADGLLMGQHVFITEDDGQDEKDGIWLSSAYIVIDNEKYYVWADNGHGKLEKRSIEVGEYDEVLDEYQVLSGLDTDDYIACDDIDLKEGMSTTKTNNNADELSTESGDEVDGSSDDSDLYDDISDESDYSDEGDYSDDDFGDSEGDIIEDSDSSDSGILTDDSDSDFVDDSDLIDESDIGDEDVN